jgi:hypothetical protein
LRSSHVSRAGSDLNTVPGNVKFCPGPHTPGKKQIDFLTVSNSKVKRVRGAIPLRDVNFEILSSMIIAVFGCDSVILREGTDVSEDSLFPFSRIFSLPSLLVSHYHLAICLYNSVHEPTHLNPEDGGRMFTRNVCIHPRNYSVLQPRRPQFYIFAFRHVSISR